MIETLNITIEELQAPASDQDLDNIFTLTKSLVIGGLDRESTIRNVEAVVENPHQHLIVARLEDQVVGMVTLTEKIIPRKRLADIDDEAISTDHLERLGIWRLLLSRVVEIADEKKLYIKRRSRSNHYREAFIYEALGFAQNAINEFTRTPRS